MLNPMSDIYEAVLYTCWDWRVHFNAIREQANALLSHNSNSYLGPHVIFQPRVALQILVQDS